MTKTTSSRIEETPRVWTLEATWTVSRDDQKVAKFLFPAFGPGTYDNVVAQVLANRKRGADLPRGSQSAFLLDEAYNSDDDVVKKSPRSEFVRRDIMHNRWLWVPKVNVTTPKKIKNPGMYSVFDENGEGLGKVYTTEELEDRLSGGDTERGVRLSQDRTVAFAPKNTIKSGYHKKGTLSQDGAFIAGYEGVEGAEAVDRVAEQFTLKPYSWVVDNNTNENIQSLSALCRSGGVVGGLDAVFNSGGGDRDGYVVSVSGSENSAEGTAPQNLSRPEIDVIPGGMV